MDSLTVQSGIYGEVGQIVRRMLKEAIPMRKWFKRDLPPSCECGLQYPCISYVDSAPREYFTSYCCVHKDAETRYHYDKQYISLN